MTRQSKKSNQDNDNGHSVSQHSVHKALTCPEDQSTWALVPSLFGGKFAWCRNNLSRCTCSALEPLAMRWACTCCRKGEMWFTHFEEFHWSTVCCFCCFCWFVACCCLGLHGVSFRLVKSGCVGLPVVSVVCPAAVGCRCRCRDSRGRGSRWMF